MQFPPINIQYDCQHISCLIMFSVRFVFINIYFLAYPDSRLSGSLSRVSMSPDSHSTVRYLEVLISSRIGLLDLFPLQRWQQRWGSVELWDGFAVQGECRRKRREIGQHPICAHTYFTQWFSLTKFHFESLRNWRREKLDNRQSATAGT